MSATVLSPWSWWHRAAFGIALYDDQAPGPICPLELLRKLEAWDTREELSLSDGFQRVAEIQRALGLA